MSDVVVPDAARRQHSALDALGQLTAQADRYNDAVRTVAEREGLGSGAYALRVLVLLALLADAPADSTAAREALGLSAVTWHRLRRHALGAGLVEVVPTLDARCTRLAVTEEGRRRMDRALSSLEVG